MRTAVCWPNSPAREGSACILLCATQRAASRKRSSSTRGDCVGVSAWALRALRPQLRRFDVQVSRWSGSYEYQRIRYLCDLGVDALVDVGANEGQYGDEVRAHGFAGRMLSIEPQAQAYVGLARRAARDPLWDCLQCGLGAEGGEAELRLSANSVSSSILPILDSHVEA